MDTQLIDSLERQLFNNTKRARVHFASTIKTIIICRLHSNELRALWLSQEDYAKYRKLNSLTLSLMLSEQGEGLLDDEFYCARGLSDDATSENRHEACSFIRKLVLNQQSFQAREGMKDTEGLAQIYKECSTQAVIQAQLTADQDAREAFDYVRS